MGKKEKLEILLKNIKEDRVSESSAQCAYYVILSFIPFVILLLTLIQYTNIEPQQLFDIISSIIPDDMKEIFNKLSEQNKDIIILVAKGMKIAQKENERMRKIDLNTKKTA